MDQPKSRFLGNVYATAAGLYCVDPRDQFVAKALIEKGAFNADEVGRIGTLLSPGHSMLILGSHIGGLAIPLSKKVKTLVAVEANPDTFNLLAINRALNGCNNIEIYHAAANDVDCDIEFVLNTVNSGGSKRMPLYKDQAFFFDNPEVTKVPAMRMDTLLKDRTFELIFMDIEGSEYFAMKGMPDLIARANIVIAEFLPVHLERVGGVTIHDFLAPLREFKVLYIPTLGARFRPEDFETILTRMAEIGARDDGLVFFRDREVGEKAFSQ